MPMLSVDHFMERNNSLGPNAAWGILWTEDNSGARSSRSRRFFAFIQITDEIYLSEEVFEDGTENS
jgi:hypothetical protein